MSGHISDEGVSHMREVLSSDEHMWLRDVRRHPDGEVRLYVDGRLVSGTFAFQVTASVDEMLGKVSR